MKKILLLFSLVLLVGCWNRNDIKKFKEEYESLNDGQIEVNINLDYQVTYLDSDETAEFLNNDTGIILFGNPEDLKTRSIVETLFMVANDNELDLKYYNPSTYEDNGIDEFADIVGALSAFLPSNDDGEKLLRTPDVYFVKDGEIVGNFYGSIDEFNDEELTDEQKEELYDHYNQLAKLVK